MQIPRFYLGIYLLFQLFASPSLLADDNSLTVKFTDPDIVMVKPEKWLKKPIMYGNWAKGADIALTLDQHLYPTFLPMIKNYAKQNSLDIAVREGTCGTSEGLINKKQVDVAGYCCPPSLTDRLPGLEFHTIGIAALAILVNPNNPVNNLSAKQVRDIFSGKITNWNQIEPAPGYKRLNLPIRPVGRLHCKTRPGHWRSILDNEDEFSPSLVEVGQISNMITVVAEYKGAVGYEVLWNLTRFHEHGKPKTVSIDNVSPNDSAAIAKGKYPFYRVDNITTWRTSHLAKLKAKKLVNYIIEKSTDTNDVFALISVTSLRKNGWKFKGNELIGEP
ncbi:MAG: substrate-binding domain-containing protein [Magnetococcales bacterium]|nr:substrate-binding domain-containing protein [Magnetococcales bacterium]